MTIASIDLGTNTVLLLIAEAENGSENVTPILNEYRIPRIGKGLLPGSPIAIDKILELSDVLVEYDSFIKKHKCEQVILSATNAMRIASNGQSIIDEISLLYGWDCRIIPGEEEARYSYLGAVAGSQNSETNLVIDIGGGSTELVFGKGSDMLFRKSYPAGVVSHTEKYFKNDPPGKNELDEMINDISRIFADAPENIHAPDNSIAIAGTPTTLACIKIGLDKFDEDLIEGSTLTIDELDELIEKLQKLSSKQIAEKYKTVTKGREDLILSGSYILKILMQMLSLDKVKVSTKGIRFGAIINYLKQGI